MKHSYLLLPVQYRTGSTGALEFKEKVKRILTFAITIIIIINNNNNNNNIASLNIKMRGWREDRASQRPC